MKKGIIIAIIVLLVLAAVVFLVKRSAANSPKTPGNPVGGYTKDSTEGLFSFSISSYGDSLGSTSDLELIRTSDKACSIRLTAREYANAKEKTKKAKGGEELIKSIENIITENGMDKWADLPDSEIFALDAATTVVSYTYAGKDYSFSSNQEFPEGGWQAIRQIEALILARLGK